MLPAKRTGGKWFNRSFPTMRTWIFLNRVFEHNKARLTVAGKCGQPKTEGVQVMEGVGLVEISLFDIIESKEAANTDKKMHSHYEVKTHWIFFFFS